MDVPATVEPSRTSLLEAASRLRQASANRTSPDWLRDTRGAVRTAMIAVEETLNALLGANSLGNEIVADEPRLLPAIEKLEADLASMLVALWRMPATAAGAGDGATLARLAGQLQTVGDELFNLVHEWATSPEALD